ncbi:MAG TPA: thioredoxin domain-containing protein [Polyangia bacterium]|nr:thioredoxin domain-containing protein [Polyangia bacterium]
MEPLQPIQPDDHVRGDAGAPVTIVEYGDYDCPHTRAAQASVDELLARGDVRFVFRYFPLRHLHVNAEILARIAEAAQRQDLFWPMHDHLMHHRRAVERDDILADAAAVGLDLRRVHPLLDDAGIAGRIERDVQGGRAAGVHSTPSFFFNGVLHDGHYDVDTLAEQLRRARQR